MYTLRERDPTAFEPPGHLVEADRVLERFGAWARDPRGTASGRCGSAEKFYKSSDVFVGSSPSMRVSDFDPERVQRALIAMPEPDRVRLVGWYGGGRRQHSRVRVLVREAGGWSSFMLRLTVSLELFWAIFQQRAAV